jgi:pimeloyl-ACP methyl ester carboxylesterase
VLFADCAADPACNAAYPDLEAKTFALANSANTDPIEITINDSDGNPVEISIDGNAILQGAFTAFYDTGLIPLLPFAAYEIADGNTALLTALAQQIVFAFSGTAVGMQSSVNCNEETPFYTQAKLDEALTGVRQEVIDAHIGITTAPALDRALRFCDDVIGTEPPAIENQAVVSDIPTLALSGQYDPVTPPQWGELAAATLSTSYAFEFPATGHGVITSRPECAGSIASQFFAEPQLAPASGCVSEIPPPAFQLRAAPAPTPAPAPTESSGVIAPPDTGSGELAGDRPIQIVLALAMVGVMLSAAGWYARTRM